MNLKKFSSFPVLMTFCAASTAGGLAELDVFLKSTDAGVLAFSQTTFRKRFDGTPRTSESQGRVEFVRPYSFRIEYEPPNEYVFVANGKTLTMHDPKLMVTTTHSQTEVMGESLTPLIEAKAIGAMSGSYDFQEGSANGFDWAIATPKPGTKSIFEKLSFGFQRNELTRLEIVNPGGDRVVYRITWESLDSPPLSRFQFSSPAGSDEEDKTNQVKPNSTSTSVR